MDGFLGLATRNGLQVLYCTQHGGGIWTEVNKPAQKSKFEVQVYPNPITDLSVLTYQLPSKTL